MVPFGLLGEVCVAEDLLGWGWDLGCGDFDGGKDKNGVCRPATNHGNLFGVWGVADDKDSLGEGRTHGLGAEFAAGGGKRDVAEALGAGVGGDRLNLGGEELLGEVLGGDYEEEVDDGGEDEEVDDGGEKGTVEDFAAVDVSDEVVEVGLADEGAEKGVDDVGGEGGDDGGEGCADDDGDGEVHYVAAQDEVTESFKQGLFSEKVNLGALWVAGSIARLLRRWCNESGAMLRVGGVTATEDGLGQIDGVE